QIKLFEMRIEACRLRAREDGTVSRIYHYPGGIVPGGDEVLASVLTGEPKVVGFLSEYNARDVIPGMQAYLTPVSGHGPVIRATVMALTPEILSLPGRVSPTPSQTYRGRRVVLMPEPGCDLLPGEEVQIHFSRPWNIRMLWDVFKRRGEKAE
ncbi:MAG: HlyD family secretion protein, partial [Kiritimatiellales bacterium]|nr:HlyD family secretion protein [Kiritimatiellales bacterium]